MARPSDLHQREPQHPIIQIRTYRSNPLLFTLNHLWLLSMASGFIYLIIIGMWVAYFLPRWISSHDDSSGRSQERYKSAMRVVADNGTATPTVDTAPRLNREEQIHQRRIIFSGILISLLVSVAMFAAGFIALPILLIPISAFGIYVVNVRRQIRISQSKARRVAAFAQISSARVITEPVVRSQVEVRESVEHWVPLAERPENSGVVIIPKESPSWEPIRIPAPTYVSAPKAIPSQRVIDLTVPGKWLEEQKRLLEAALPSREDLFDQDLLDNAAQEPGQAANE